MILKVMSLVAVTILVAGTIAAISSLAAATTTYAQTKGNDWCYTRGTPIIETRICFDNRGDCNKTQASDLLATSPCFKRK